MEGKRVYVSWLNDKLTDWLCVVHALFIYLYFYYLCSQYDVDNETKNIYIYI